MSNTKRIIIAVAVVAAVVAGAVAYSLLVGNKTSAPEAENTGQQQQTNDADVASVITYNGSTFSVSNNTVASGSTVKVVNDSSEPLDFSSDPHPVHTDNSELNEGEIAPGESKTFVLEEKGTWGFHDHLNASATGSMTVE